MSVEVPDVRIALGGMTEGEIPSQTIVQKLRDAERLANTMGLPVTPASSLELREAFIRDYAAWRSFLLSRSFTRIDLADIKVQSDIRMKTSALEDQVKTDLEIVSGINGVIVQTAMFDDRPDDPFEYGEDEDTTIVVHS